MFGSVLRDGVSSFFNTEGFCGSFFNRVSLINIRSFYTEEFRFEQISEVRLLNAKSIYLAVQCAVNVLLKKQNCFHF